MPQFKVTGPDGRRLTITGDTMPSGEELDEIFAQAPPVEATEGPSLLGRGLDVLGRVGQTLGRTMLSPLAPIAVDEAVDTFQGEQSLGQGVGDFFSRAKRAYTPEILNTGKLSDLGKWQENPDFNQVLEAQGVEDILKKHLGEKGGDWATAGLGFAGDVLVDPARIKMVQRGASALIGGAGKGIGKAVKAITPDSVQAAVKEGFVPESAAMAKFQAPGSDINYADKIRLHESSLRHAAEAATDFSKDVFKSTERKLGGYGGLKDIDELERVKFSHAMDQGASVPRGMEKQQQVWKDTAERIWAEKQAMGTTDAEKIKNYVPYFTKDGRSFEAVVGPSQKVGTRTDKARKGYETLDEAVRLGKAPADAREILGTMVSMHEKAKRTHGFLQETVKDFGQDVAAEGMRKLNRKALGVPDKLWETMENKYFPAEMADYLERSVKLWEKPSELDNLWKTGTKIFKGLATSVNVPHHATNELGNMMNMYTAGGMSVPEIGMEMARAAKILTHKAKNKTVSMPSIGNWDGATLSKLAHEYEVVGTSGHLRELSHASGLADKWASLTPLQAARRFGTEVIEEPARLALWMHGIRKGMTPAQSAIKVKNVLIDYAELTKFEQGVRDYAVPFYTWLRKNPEIQLKALAENPRQFSNITDLVNVPWNANKDQVAQTVIPESMETDGLVPGFLDAEGGELSMQRLALPQTDLNKIANPLEMIVDAAHPALRMAIEGATGQKLRGGKVASKDGFAPPSGLASIVSALLPDAVEGELPAWAQGYLNTVNVGGKPRQRDYAAWAQQIFPTGVYGQLGRRALEDESTSAYTNGTAEVLSRLAGLTPRAITGDAQKYEAQARKAAHRRKMATIVLER